MASTELYYEKKQLFMIGGPNGAGKTTTSFSIMPEILQCDEYVNADTIASSLSPFRPETMAMRAGRLMLQRINDLANKDSSFAFETTMASKTFHLLLKSCKRVGYQINLLYLWLSSPELSIERVKERNLMGGHSIPDRVIRRRYYRSMYNFTYVYMPLADR